ncbi:hypothetical protein [Spirosoma pollinicola]|uniref:DUF3303 domain-containing protein n=1 Tax=Spirosoma pollinicola TaxID=2057025 RepID=A0A2K8Z480_9BACT|nr:hypothetical protein [Spirosoma pollinicola]AUD04706.1 hypothetical protein CWM47_24380 [Spirosoma pollinicola]
MWYFLIKQRTLERTQLQYLQKAATLTEVEIFNEPFENWLVFSVEKDAYTAFMDYLDREGIAYDLTATRPTRDEMLASMR